MEYERRYRSACTINQLISMDKSSDDINSTTTKLLTLLNVSVNRAGKRKYLLDSNHTPVKLNRRKTSTVTEEGTNEVAKDFDIDDVKVDEDGASMQSIYCLL